MDYQGGDFWVGYVLTEAAEHQMMDNTEVMVSDIGNQDRTPKAKDGREEAQVEIYLGSVLSYRHY